MEKHLGTRYELLAEGREPRTFIDPQRAGAAFFDAHRDELPQLVQHDVYSIDGGDPQARHAVIGVTEHDSAGAHVHKLLGMPADVRQGYDAAAQRSPAKAIALTEEPRQFQELQPGLTGAPRAPVTLALHERFELHREGHAPQQFGNARQAGAAFYAAPIEHQPRLLHLQPDQEPREVGSTASVVGMFTELGVYQYPNKVLANDLLVDVEVRAGYFSAMEQSVSNGLHVTDWQAATDSSPWVVPRLDQRLYADLQELTVNHRELALQAWLDHAPEDAQRPTFIDLSTGQVATLDKAADMSMAKVVQQYVYGKPEVLVPPLDQEAARLAPPHAMVQEPQGWFSKAPISPHLSNTKGSAVSEQQPSSSMPGPIYEGPDPIHAVRISRVAGAPKQAFESPRPGEPTLSLTFVDSAGQLITFERVSASVMGAKFGKAQRTNGLVDLLVNTPKGVYDIKGVDPGDIRRATSTVWEHHQQRLVELQRATEAAHVTFSKKRTPLGPEYTVRAWSADSQLVVMHKHVLPEELAGKLGDRWASAILARAGRTGTITVQQLIELERAAPARAPVAQVEAPTAPTPGQAQQIETLAAPAPMRTAQAEIPVALASAQAAKAAPAAAVINRIEPLTVRAQQQVPQQTTQAPTPAQAPAQQAPAAQQGATKPWTIANGMDRLVARFKQDRAQDAVLPEQASQVQAAPAAEANSATPAQPQPAHVPLTPWQAKAAQQCELMTSLYERFDVRGNDFCFKGEAGRVAFTDHGKQLSSKSDVPAVVRAMVDMVQAKGWEGIRINGSAEFMRSVWLEATLRGIDVQGHAPTAEDRKRLMQAQRQRAEKEQQMQQGLQQAATRHQPEHSGNTVEQAQAMLDDVKREQAMNAMRSYLDTQKLDAPTVAEAMKEWGAHIDKAIAQGKAVPTVQVYDPAVARAAAPTQAVVPQTAVHERSAPSR